VELIRRLHLMREAVRKARAEGKKIAFVPTMGALHDGHLALVRRARELGDIVVVSIFVNPEQFGPDEDYDTYPRDLARDTDLCVEEHVDFIFAPDPKEMYPDGFRTYVEVEGLSSILEGASRPGFFRGVCTAVLKLLSVVNPHFAFFGQKDMQQAVIVQTMVRDLNLNVEIVLCPTVRDDDGVALSSRNVRLNVSERVSAMALRRALERGRVLIEDQGVSSVEEVETKVRDVLGADESIKIDYFAVVDPVSLERPETIGGEVLLLLAVWIGQTRLIDNISACPEPPDEAE